MAGATAFLAFGILTFGGKVRVLLLSLDSYEWLLTSKQSALLQHDIQCLRKEDSWSDFGLRYRTLVALHFHLVSFGHFQRLFCDNCLDDSTLRSHSN